MRDLTKEIDELPDEQQQSSASDNSDLVLSIVKLVWSRRWFLLRASFAGLVLGTLIAFLVPKRYQSTTRLMPPDAQMTSSLGIAASIANGNANLSQVADLLPMKSTGALFLGILRSRTVEDRLVERFDLKKVYRKNLMIDARQQLEDNTAITEDRRGGIIGVTVTDRDPQRAAAIARAYVEELDRLVVELNTSAAHRERVFIEDQLKQVKRDLDDASRQLSEFSSKNATIDVKEQAKAMVGAAAALEGQLIAAESELKGVEQIYTTNNVRVRATQARVAELRAQLQKLEDTPKHAEDGRAQADSASYPSLRNLPIVGLKYADLYRRATIQDAVFETLSKQYEVARVEEAKETPSVRVLDIADVPERKSGPFRLGIMLVSSLLSFGLATIWILGYSKWKSVDVNDPTKLFVQVVVEQIRLDSRFARTNGSGFHGATAAVWRRLNLKSKRASKESAADK
jgi:capsule polysaccharide export protein KpsE/RkpR